MQSDLIQRLRVALPQLHSWIDQYLTEHELQARSVSSYGWKRLAMCYPPELLEHAKVVAVERVPFPPVDKFGLPEFASHQQRLFDGITFKNTFFVRKDRQSEGLYFHELVHVVQWERLGPDNFLLAYGIGLARLGYENSPLEQMAYELQRMFDSGTLPARPLIPFIQEITDAVWSHPQQSL
jgi:hypothetical protein